MSQVMSVLNTLGGMILIAGGVFGYLWERTWSVRSLLWILASGAAFVLGGATHTYSTALLGSVLFVFFVANIVPEKLSQGTHFRRRRNGV